MLCILHTMHYLTFMKTANNHKHIKLNSTAHTTPQGGRGGSHHHHKVLSLLRAELSAGAAQALG